MRSFDYLRATDLAAIPPGGTLLAGGQTLLPAMKARDAAPALLVDVKTLLPTGIDVTPGAATIGAGATHAAIAADARLHTEAPWLAALAGEVGDPSVRHRGTLGGAIVSDHPAGDWPAAALALDAVIETDRRRVPFAAFRRETDRDPAEIVLRITFARPDQAAYVKFLHPAQRYAIVGVFVARFADRRAVAVTGLRADGACLWQASGPSVGHGVAGAGPLEGDDASMRSDSFAGPAYRRNLVERLCAVAEAHVEDGGEVIDVLIHGQPRSTSSTPFGS